MALNFNLLNPDLPEQIAGSFQQGYQGAQDRANVLEQREQQKRDRIAQIIQDGAKSIVASPGAYKSIFARVKKVAGVPLDNDEKQYDQAFATGGEDAVKKLAMADANFDIQTVLSLRDREAFEAYLKGQQPTTTPANALTAARVAPGALGSGTFDPNAPTNALTPTAQAPAAPVNALASAPVDQRTAIQNEILQLSRFTDPRAVARVKALQNQLEQMKLMEVGGNVLDPITRTFIQAPAKPDYLSPEALRQKLQIAAAGRAPGSTVSINTQLPASEEAQKEFMKEMRQTYGALKQAPTVLQNIEDAKKLIPQAKGFMGAGGESILQAASFLNNRLGTNIDTKGVKSAEELRSRLFLGIMDNLKKLDSQPSQQQQAALQIALGSIGTDPGALPAVLDVFGETVRQKVDLYNQEAISAEERGVKFPYKPTIALKPRNVNQSATTLTPQDRQALEWANSNPKDPRALQIKQRLGQ